MIRSIVMSAALILGLAQAASAAVLVAPLDNSSDSAIIKVAENCGAGWWRGPGGACHPFYGPGGSLRGTRFACPPGFHVGPYGHRCWRNW